MIRPTINFLRSHPTIARLGLLVAFVIGMFIPVYPFAKGSELLNRVAMGFALAYNYFVLLLLIKDEDGWSEPHTVEEALDAASTSLVDTECK
ncbi:MAG TPA: hypothetical protein VEF04_05390 [Blastocatellia bacterium]|nr:hypothetical protein [Blastocatellia bacterium]